MDEEKKNMTFPEVVNEESKDPAGDHGFQMGVDPGSDEGDKTAVTMATEASGLDGVPATEFEMIGTVELPKSAKAEEPPPPAEEPPPQAKVVGIKEIKETTKEEWSSFIVGLDNPDTKAYEEYLVPKNTLKLYEALELRSRNGGEAYAKAQVKVFKIAPNQGPKGDMVAMKLQLLDLPMDKALLFIKKYMLTPPNEAYQFLLRNAEPVFESSDCMFIDVLAYFESKGATGLTLMTPHIAMTEEHAMRYYNALVAHVEMFKTNMKTQGIDLDKKTIIQAPAGMKVDRDFRKGIPGSIGSRRR